MNWSLWCGYKKAGRLTNSATTEALFQGFELFPPPISTLSIKCKSWEVAGPKNPKQHDLYRSL